MSKSPAARRITTDQLVALSDQLQALVRCGVPLEPSLVDLASDLSGEERTIVAELAEDSQSGQSLEHWLQSKSSELPAVFRAIVRAGIRAGRLDAALQKLSEDHRIVVLLHDTEGYKLEEIQDLTGVPVGTIKSRLHRARARLRQILEEDGTFS